MSANLAEAALSEREPEGEFDSETCRSLWAAAFHSARCQIQLVRVDGEVTARATDEPSPPAQYCHERSLARRRPAWRPREVDRACMHPRLWRRERRRLENHEVVVALAVGASAKE